MWTAVVWLVCVVFLQMPVTSRGSGLVACCAAVAAAIMWAPWAKAKT